MERDQPCHINLHSTPHFNSHAHVERDDFNAGLQNCTSDFNSHAHVERDFGLLQTLNSVKYFNSHAHVERDIVVNDLFVLYVVFQLTRSRGA